MATRLFLLAIIALAVTTVQCWPLSHRKLLQAADLKTGKVMGYVVCDACLEKNLSRNSLLLSGMTVAVTCKVGNHEPFYSVLQNTDRQGRFVIDLPHKISASDAHTKFCTANVIRAPSGSCNIPLNSHAPLTFHTMLHGHPIFSTGPFVYAPAKPYASCPGRSSELFQTENSSPLAGTQQEQQLKPQEATYSASSSSSSNNNVYANQKAPAFSFPTFPKFGGINLPPPLSFSTPASQFPITSLFPPIPANAPPVFPQLPPLLGFPQLPSFQFPFFAAPPPPGS